MALSRVSRFLVLALAVASIAPMRGALAEPGLWQIAVDPFSRSARWTADGGQPYASFGYSVAAAGDVNGDGFDDAIVGAPYYDNVQPDGGRAFVYHGSAAGLSTNPNWTAKGRQYVNFGISVALAGDVNGDGFDDVIVGAWFDGTGGRAFVFHGSASGLSTVPDWVAYSNQSASVFGFSVGTAGDVDGDGFDDVIVGAYQYDNGQTDEGRAFVYNGSASGLSTTPSWNAEGDQDFAVFGWSVGTAGDVNGDGFDEVIVGAPFFSNGQFEEGKVFVYQGSASGLSATPNWTAESDVGNADFGISVGGARDVNDDGFDDVIVGAQAYTNDQALEGRAFAYHGSASGLSATPNWTAESNQEDAFFGWSVGTAGDVDGDGFDDVIVGARGYETGQTDEGRAFVFRGSPAGPSATPDWTAESNQAYASFGWSVGTAGDVDGDGFDDVIVGAPYQDRGQESEGGAVVISGMA